jgi:hypothetical protein
MPTRGGYRYDIYRGNGGEIDTEKSMRLAKYLSQDVAGAEKMMGYVSNNSPSRVSLVVGDYFNGEAERNRPRQMAQDKYLAEMDAMQEAMAKEAQGKKKLTDAYKYGR